MKALLIVTAAIEVGVGIGFALFPALLIPLLVGVPLDLRAGVVIARITAAALVALGLACWLARENVQSRAASGLVTAILVYNIAAAIVLAYAGIGMRLSGMGLWPAVLLHTAMAIWCITCLRASGQAH